MTAALMLTAMTKVQAQDFEGPCLPQMHGMDDHQSALCGSTQSITLAEGVNWVSFYIETNLDDLKVALQATGLATATNTIVIQSKDNGMATYNGTRWRGTLSTLDLTQMYLITVPGDCEIVLEAMRINPTEHSITIHNGANWIPYLLSESMPITDAFAGLAAQNGDVVNSKNNGLTTYNNRWRGQLTTLVPGQGYIYNSTATEDKTFTYSSSKK